MPPVAARVERPLMAAVTVAVAVVGSLAAVVPAGRLPGQFWIASPAYLAVGLLGAGAGLWRASRSAGRRRTFWTCLGAGQAAWSAGEALFLVLGPMGLYSFPSWVDLLVVVSYGLNAAALVAYPSGSRITRVRRLLDAVMTTLAVGLVMWQAWLGPVVAAATPDSVLRSAAGIFFPVASTLLLIVGLVALSHSPAGRLPLGVVMVGHTLVACGGIWYAQMQSGDDQQQLSGFAWSILGYASLALAALLRQETPPVPDPAVAAVPAIRLLPYLPVVVALLTSVVSLLRDAAGPIEIVVSATLVVLIMIRQYLTLWQNVRLTRLVQVNEEQLRFQAFHDGLTGLANRALFRDRLEHAVALHARDMRPVSLLFLDLDDFKGVNDTSGHAVGDQLLIRVADRLREITRTGDTVARLGGDEFAVLLEDDADPVASADRIGEALALSFDTGSGTVRVGASIGVVELAPSDIAVSPDELLARADTAMYRAKRRGKGRRAGRRAGTGAVEPEDQRLRDVLLEALADGSFRAVFQPIVEVSTGRVVAVEALARLRYGTRDIHPEGFVAAAARTGVLPELTDAVLRQACACVAAAGEGSPGDPIAVHLNVLPSQVGSPGLRQTVVELGDTGLLRPGQLVLEIVETAPSTESGGFEAALPDLRARGVRVALGGFGAGYSSLGRLGELEFDMVKIHRSVLDRIDTGSRQLAIVDAVLGLHRRLDTPVIAEGVERPEQLAALERLGCRMAQGYLLGRPMPASELGRWLATTGPPSSLVQEPGDAASSPAGSLQRRRAGEKS